MISADPLIWEAGRQVPNDLRLWNTRTREYDQTHLPKLSDYLRMKTISMASTTFTEKVDIKAMSGRQGVQRQESLALKQCPVARQIFVESTRWMAHPAAFPNSPVYAKRLRNEHLTISDITGLGGKNSWADNISSGIDLIMSMHNAGRSVRGD